MTGKGRILLSLLSFCFIYNFFIFYLGLLLLLYNWISLQCQPFAFVREFGCLLLDFVIALWEAHSKAKSVVSVVVLSLRVAFRTNQHELRYKGTRGLASAAPANGFINLFIDGYVYQSRSATN